MKKNGKNKEMKEIEIIQKIYELTNLDLTAAELRTIISTVLKNQSEPEHVSEPSIITPGKVSYGNFSIAGLGPDAPLAEGGLQSHVDYRFDLLPPLALAKVAAVLNEGAKKYDDNSWTKLNDPGTHLNHALGHILAHLAGDRSEGLPEAHLAHAGCRILFAVDVIEREKQISVMQ